MAGSLLVGAKARRRHDPKGIANGVDTWPGWYAIAVVALLGAWDAGGSPVLAEDAALFDLGYFAQWTGGHIYGDIISQPIAVSSDGSVVVGWSNNSDGTNDWIEAFRWTEDGGMEGLGYLAAYSTGYRNSNATAVSSDGSVVVGDSSNSDGTNNWDEAFRWTEDGGMEGLGYLAAYAGGYRYSYATAVSLDGSVVVGRSSNSDGTNDWDEAFRWTEGGGMEGLGYLAAWTSGYGSSYANAVSADGSVVVGTSSNSDGTNNWYEAFRWIEGGSMEGLGYLNSLTDGSHSSSATAVSSDGSVVVGTSSNSDGTYNWNEAFRWTEGGGMEGLGYLGTSTDVGGRSSPTAMSTDGSVVVGTSSNTDGTYDWNEAFRWTEGGGMEGLGYFAAYTNGYRISAALAVSSDGSVVVGGSSNSDGTSDWIEAFRWTTTTGMQSVADWLGPSVDLDGISLYAATAVSADGSVVAGVMTRDNGASYQAFLARVGGLITEEAAYESIASLHDVDQAINDRLGSVLGS